MYVWVIRLIILFAILAAVYLALSQYSRWTRRKTLEAEYDAADTHEDARDEYIARGMAEYEHSLSKYLLLGIFVVPIAVVALLLAIAAYM